MFRIYNDSHFEILGVTRLSTKNEIKKAFKKQMNLWHPDKFFDKPEKINEALERSKKINEAFSFLKDYIPPQSDTINTSTNKSESAFTKSKPTSKHKGIRLNIQRIRVKSSNIHSIGYDPKLCILQVEFFNSGIYQYYEVPENIFEQLMEADSKGKFFNRNIAIRYHYESF